MEKLSELFQNGKLTREEFEIAKRKVLESPQISHASSEQDQLEAIRLQNEIAQHDHQWEIERREYMVQADMDTATFLGDPAVFLLGS